MRIWANRAEANLSVVPPHMLAAINALQALHGAPDQAEQKMAVTA